MGYTVAMSNPWATLPSQVAPLLVAGQTLLLVTCRLLPLVVLTPVFGGQSLPARLRLVLAAALGLGLCGAGAEPAELIAGLSFGVLLVKEIVVGFVLSAGVLVMFQVPAAFGQITDRVRGHGQLTLHDPHFRQQHTPLSMLMQMATVAAFLSAGGAGLLLEGLARSVECWPVRAGLPPALARVSLTGVVSLGSGLWLSAVQLAAPTLIAGLLIDLSAALVQRAAQRGEFPQLAFVVKGSVLVALLVAVWPWVVRGLGQALAAAVRFVPQTVGG